MSDIQLLQYDSIDELRCHADTWDDLWRRSHSTRPVARAAPVAHWIEHFAAGARFRALVVKRSGQLLAALPLIGRRVGGVLEAGCLPHNAWSPAGELLLDRDADAADVLRRLVTGFTQLPWKLVWLDAVPLDAPPWDALRSAVVAAGLTHTSRQLFQVGRVDVAGDWASYRETWSKNHRRNMTKAQRRLERAGGVEVQVQAPGSDDALQPLLRRIFEIEDRSWKGQAGSSVLRSRGMFEFFVGQARLLAAAGQLRVALLKCSGHPIAFEYALAAKGSYHALKVGYDQEFARYSPGQLLTRAVLHRYFQDSDNRQYDCMGPLSEAIQKWRPRRYSLGRLVIARPGLLGRLMLAAYQICGARVGRLLPKR